MTTEESGHDVSGYAQHYNASGASVREIISEILEDVTTFKSVHNWEERLIISPISLLKVACRQYMHTNQGRLDFLLGHANVSEVFGYQGTTHFFPAMAHPGDVDRHLFFLNVSIHNIPGSRQADKFFRNR
jgi:hypothetical protein